MAAPKSKPRKAVAKKRTPKKKTAARKANKGAVARISGDANAFVDGMVEDIREIRAFLFERMYRHWRVLRMRRKAGGVVQDLFRICMETPGVMPDDWRAVAAHAVSETARARVVADWIAGMTDRFALEEHRQLTDPQARV